PRPRGDGGRGSPISRIVDELKLSQEQHDKVMAIFKQAMTEAPPPPFEAFRKCDKKRDAALDALLTDEQRAQAGEINAEFEREMEQLNAPGMAVFKKAQADARALLTPEQQAQFDQLISEKMPSFRGRWKGQPGAREGERRPPEASTMPG
ncbi:MAG TPA: Spy/CpxP family protein refolding chaperone, partial [Tepidisphaeraceae bacterium]|nr:Spy/CpxP family protein refolding chaperone [Tepidisphaeraceae bacterium]